MTLVQGGKGCSGRGTPSSSVSTVIAEVRAVEMLFPSHMLGPPIGWRSAIIMVAIERPRREEQKGFPVVGQCSKARHRGQWRNLEAAASSSERAVAPSAP